MAQFMGRLVGDVLTGAPRSTTCLYTLTADRDFVLDRVPDHPQVLVALGAAHGFKFASWFGRRWRNSSSTAAPSTTSPRSRSPGRGLRGPVAQRDAWLV